MSSALKKAREFRLDAQARYEERRKQRSESDAVKVVPVDITLAPGPSRPSAKSIDFSVQVICEGGARFVSLTMDANSTMDQVKEAVECNTGHAARSQRLTMESHPRLCATDRLSSFDTALLETIKVTVLSSLMQVFVVEPTRGDTHCVDVTPSQTIRELKEAIAYLTGSDPKQAVIELDGKALKDDRKLKDAKVRKGSTLLLRTCSSGGASMMDGEEECGVESLVSPAQWRSAYQAREDEDEGFRDRGGGHSLLVDMDGPQLEAESPGLYRRGADDVDSVDGFGDWGGPVTDEE